MADETQYFSVAGDISHSGGGAVRYGHRIMSGDQFGPSTFLVTEIEAKRVEVPNFSTTGSTGLETRYSVAPTLHFFREREVFGSWLVAGVTKVGVEVGNGAAPAPLVGLGVELVDVLGGYVFDARFDHASGRSDAFLLGASKFF